MTVTDPIQQMPIRNQEDLQGCIAGETAHQEAGRRPGRTLGTAPRSRRPNHDRSSRADVPGKPPGIGGAADGEKGGLQAAGQVFRPVIDAVILSERSESKDLLAGSGRSLGCPFDSLRSLRVTLLGMTIEKIPYSLHIHQTFSLLLRPIRNLNLIYLSKYGYKR